MMSENNSLKTIAVTVLLVGVMAIPSVGSAGDRTYSGLAVGSMDYREQGTALGTDYDQTWSHTSFEGKFGYDVNRLLDFEVRYGFSGTANEEVLGVEFESQVDHYYGGFAKVKMPNESIRPYALGGYTTGDIKFCGTSCSTTVEWSGASFGLGLEIPLQGSSLRTFYVEGIQYASENKGGTKQDVSGLNAGVTFKL